MCPMYLTLNKSRINFDRKVEPIEAINTIIEIENLIYRRDENYKPGIHPYVLLHIE